MAVLSSENRSGVLILWIDNPPVNALSQAVRSALLNAISKECDEGNNTAIIIACRGRTFIAGADIREFGKPPAEPYLPDVIAAIESASKPVIAAIHGHALGGGLEVALGCHYRIAAAGSQLGLPETNLGIVPGAGGTQRLPRLIGAVDAAEMICGGKPVSAEKALELGLVDKLTDDDVVSTAISYSLNVTKETLGYRRLSERKVSVDDILFSNFDKIEKKIQKQAKGATAPLEAFSLIRKTIDMPFTEGKNLERETFLKLAGTTEAKALRHIFFAERGVGRAPSNSNPRKLNKIGVVGAGTMGVGIAMTFADAGYPVSLTDISEEALGRGKFRLRSLYESQVKRGRISERDRESRTQLIQFSVGYDVLADADLIIEAAFEATDVKCSVFKKLDGVAKRGAVLATNTSYLDINVIAEATSRPQDVLGLHYFSAANVMKLVEVVRGQATSPDTLSTALTAAKVTGKIAVIAGVCHGFIGNRMLRAYVRESGLMMLEGALPSEVDRALTDFGMSMGPFSVADLAGLDIGYKARQEMQAGSFEPMATAVHDRLVEKGHLGQKSGAGFYRYNDKTRAKSPHPIVEDLIAMVRKEAGVKTRLISSEEIVSRTMLALINEGCWILEEKISERMSDIDVVYVHGYGFPRWRGGPMCYGESIGWAKVLKQIQQHVNGPYGRWWNPSQYIKKLANDHEI